MRIERLRREYDIEVELVHFPLHPETPPEGTLLTELFGTTEDRVLASQERLRQLAENAGLAWGPRSRTYNSRLAQELGAWAAAQGKGDAFHDAVFRAYFGEAKNIADKDVLGDIAAAAGLDRASATRVLEAREFRAAVNADWTRSMRDGVQAVPTYVAGGQSVEGAEPYEVLEKLVVQAGARKRGE